MASSPESMDWHTGTCTEFIVAVRTTAEGYLINICWLPRRKYQVNTFAPDARSWCITPGVSQACSAKVMFLSTCQFLLSLSKNKKQPTFLMFFRSFLKSVSDRGHPRFQICQKSILHNLLLNNIFRHKAQKTRRWEILILLFNSDLNVFKSLPSLY